MSDTNTNPVETTVPVQTDKAANRPRALQSRRMSELLENLLEWMQKLENDAGLRAQLASFGYDANRLDEGFGLGDAARTAYLARQQAVTDLTNALQAAQLADENARRAFANFRTVALTVVTDQGIRTALSADRRMPLDREEFISVARAVYNTVLANPAYASALAAHGYPAPVLQSTIGLLDSLSAALVQLAAAGEVASQSVGARDAAILALAAWVRAMRRIVKVAANASPDLAQYHNL